MHAAGRPGGSSKSPTRRRTAGFTVMQLLVAATVVGVIAVVGVPSVKRSARETRRQAAYRAVYQVESAIKLHVLSTDAPPSSEMNPSTLDELVESESLSARHARSLLSSLEGDSLDSYVGLDESWDSWSYHYFLMFRPKGEPDSYCYLIPGEGWCWYPAEGTWESIRE